MAKINYTFADGHTEEIEVTDEFALQYEMLEDERKRQEEREKKRRKRRLSYEGLADNGYEFEDKTCLNPLEQLIEQEDEQYSLISLSDFLTDRHKQIMRLYYDVGMSKTEIAKVLNITKVAVQHHLENLGFVPGSNVRVVTKMGGNIIVQVKEARVAISSEMAQKIFV